MAPTPMRAASARLAAAILAASAPAAAAGQAGSRLPVVPPGDPRPAVAGGGGAPGVVAPGPAPPGRALPLDPDARGLARAPLRDGPRRLPGPRRPRPFPFLVPLFGAAAYGQPVPPAAGAGEAGGGSEGARRRGAARDRPRQGSRGRAPPPAAEDREGEAEVCLELAVGLSGGGTYRTRLDGASLDAATPAEAERALREEMASRDVLAVEGMDGVSLRLPASRVRDVAARPCPAVVTRGDGGP